MADALPDTSAHHLNSSSSCTSPNIMLGSTGHCSLRESREGGKLILEVTWLIQKTVGMARSWRRQYGLRVLYSQSMWQEIFHVLNFSDWIFAYVWWDTLQFINTLTLKVILYSGSLVHLHFNGNLPHERRDGILHLWCVGHVSTPKLLDFAAFYCCCCWIKAIQCIAVKPRALRSIACLSLTPGEGLEFPEPF